MLTAAVDPAALADALNDNGVVIAPNQRLAQALRSSWGQQQANSAWPAAAIYALDEWIALRWQQFCSAQTSLPATCLHPIIEERLWRQAIESCQPELEASRYSAMAAQAYQLLENWQLDPTDLAIERSASEQFGHWCRRYRQLLQNTGAISAEQRLELLIAASENGHLTPQHRVTLCGFQSLPPLRKKLLDVSFNNHHQLSTGQDQSNHTFLLQRDSDPASELYRAIDSALKTSIEQPSSLCAIVISDLECRLNEVERVAERLTNHYQLPKNAINISASRTLAEQPLVATAALLLKAFSTPLKLHEWLHLLHSPYWLAAGCDTQTIADAELTLRKTGARQFSCNEVVGLLVEESVDQESDDEQIAPAHSGLIWLRQHWGNKHSLNGWGEKFAEGLHAFGFCRQRSLDSAEYQQYQQWLVVLEELLQLELPEAFNSAEMSAQNAVSYLNDLLYQRRFQPQAGSAQIHILGTLEAIGLRFDRLHWLDLSSTTLPAPLNPNPLLGLSWQRRHTMPRSDHAREHALAELLIQTMQRCCTTFIASCALRDGDAELEPSPLLHELPAEIFSAEKATPPPWLVYSGLQTTRLEDFQAPSLQPDEKIKNHGSSVLKDQAASPFNAFLQHRLAALPLEQPSVGVTPMLRGILMHKALELLLPAGLDSDKLATLMADSDALSSAIQSAIASAVNSVRRDYPILKRESVVERESERQEWSIRRWLELEEQRGQFAIEAVEEKVFAQLNNLTLPLKIDRIDRVGEQRLIIDYKSGGVKQSDWHTERLRDPQLPLYSMALAAPPDGVSFGLIRPDKIHLSGESCAPLMGSTTTAQQWQTQLQLWRSQLEELAEEFCRGDANLTIYDRETFEKHQSDLRRISRSFEWTSGSDKSTEADL